MVQVIQVDLQRGDVVQQFLRLPFRVYRGIPQWVPPLEVDARRMLDARHHPFYRHSEAAFFLACADDGQAVGRIAVLNHRPYNEFNHSQAAFFYLFECLPDEAAGAALFEAACGWARQRGLGEIVGPKGFTALDGLGLLTRGFEHRPALGIPYNPPYYVDMVQAAGFVPIRDIVSGHLDAQNLAQGQERFARIHQLAEWVQQRRGLRVGRFSRRRDLRPWIPRLQDLYNGSLQGTSGNAPLTADEARMMADQILWFADPRLIKIVFKDDEPVGFLFAYPDISAAIQRTSGRLWPWGWADMLGELRRTRWVNINGAGIIEAYRGLGGTAILFSEMYKSIVEGKFEHADLVQIGMENEAMQRELRDLGIDFFKMHRLYQRQL